MLCIKNGTIHDAVHEQAFQGDILVENGKIKAIGENLKTGEDDQIVDVKGLSVYPGFVEAHGHIGLDGYGIGYEGMDYNEMNDIVSPSCAGSTGLNRWTRRFPGRLRRGLPASAWGRAAPTCWAAPLPPLRRWESGWPIWWCGTASP